MMDQSVLDRAVRIATDSAVDGNPIERMVWVPPMTPASDPRGGLGYHIPAPAVRL